ncbi:ATP-binding protein [Streptomyces sp. NPDC006798]|uniref:ATP-binding protein n=1 Tax=Streptomyces sp. NPDC006798 TaxID=3155462 RepID=UPI0033E1F79E
MAPPATHPAPVTVRMFCQRFSSTPLGAHLARHAALRQLRCWNVPYESDAVHTTGLIVAEPAANAVTHGRIPGRDFELRLAFSPALLRIEVSDTRGERRPPNPGELADPGGGSVSGRGLLLVEALADRWAVLDRVPVGKTIRAEIDLPPPS